MKRISTKTLAIVIISIVLVTRVVIFVYYKNQSKRLEDTENSLINTGQILSSSQKILTLITADENRINNYIITDKNEYLASFNNSKNELFDEINKLQKLTKTGSAQYSAIDSLIFYTKQKFNIYDSVIVAKQNNDKSKLALLQQSPESASIINKIYHLITGIQQEENKLLNERREENATSIRKLDIVFYTAISIVLVFGIIIFFKLRKDYLTQQKTNQQLKYMAALLNESNDAIISADINFNVETWNKGAEKLYGYSEAEVKGKNAAQVVRSQLSLEEIESVRTDLRNNGYWKGEVLELNKKDEKLFISGVLTVLKNEQGQAVGYVTVNRNITDIKKAEKEISDMEKLIEASNDAIFSTDMNLNIKTWNKGAEQLYGYSQEDILGKNAIDMVKAVTTPSQIKEVWNILKQTKHWQGEVLQYNKNNEQISVHVSMTAITDEQGWITDIISVNENITERKKIEQQLKNLSERLELEVNEKTAELKEIFERVSDGFIALNKDWQYTYVNQKAGEMFGKDPEQLIGKNIFNEFPESDKVFYKAFQKAMQEQKYVYVEDYYQLFDFWLANHIYPSANGLSIYFRDITDKKKAQEELVRMNYRLRNLSSHLQNAREEERKYIAKEIHDQLGQQVTALKIDMTFLRKKIPADQTDLHERAAGIISLLDDTVKTIRKISLELRPSILDDLGLIAALEWQFVEFEKRTGIKCTFINQLKNYTFTNDIKTNIFRICQEALTNIMRYSLATKVDCSFIEENNKLIFILHDNGVGFDVNQKKQTFGLISMQERALMIQGEFSIESKPGKGTTINVKLDI
jgi:PAS domain S-box-containing protein